MLTGAVSSMYAQYQLDQHLVLSAHQYLGAHKHIRDSIQMNPPVDLLNHQDLATRWCESAQDCQHTAASTTYDNPHIPKGLQPHKALQSELQYHTEHQSHVNYPSGGDATEIHVHAHNSSNCRHMGKYIHYTCISSPRYH